MAVSYLQPRSADADAYIRAELAYLRAMDERQAPVDALLTARPDFLAAWLLKIGKGVAAKDASALPGLAEALAAAARLERHATAAQRIHLAAARAWLAREPLRSARLYTRLSAAAPHDLLALRLAQSCWYFLGERAQVRRVAERALRRGRAPALGYDAVLAMAAFGNAETGDGRAAVALAQRALAIEPRSALAHHALVHGLTMQGLDIQARRVLQDGEPQWRHGGRMDAHNDWHLGALALELGQPSAALATFDRALAGARDVGTHADATDLLWRLELAGVEVGRRWQPLADAWARRLTPGFWSFLDVLAGLALHRAGRAADAYALLRVIERARVPDGTAPAAAAARAALAAIEAFAQGDYVRSSVQMRGALPLLGGSAPQRELFEATLRVAERRAGAERRAAAAA